MDDVNQHGIYTDLLRCFLRAGDNVYVVSAHERRENKPTTCTNMHAFHVLQVKTGNIRECGLVEKGISTLLIERQYLASINKFYHGITFDLVLYSTPPITFANVIEHIVRRDKARSYLLLKDIFPQNAVDLGMMDKSGIKSVIYKFFRRKELKLYRISDNIGCMSEANCDYIIRHTPFEIESKIEVCPNSVEIPQRIILNQNEKFLIRSKYSIPPKSRAIIYGGNLGKAQGIPYLIEALRSQANNEKVFYAIIGKGTEYAKLEAFIANERIKNAILYKYMPEKEYDNLVRACDVGLLFLDPRFSIPNFPSRLLSYMASGIPVLACTDPNTDVGKVITQGDFGWWCRSDDTETFTKITEDICETPNLLKMGENAYKYLCEHYDVTLAYKTIMSHVGGRKQL